MITWAELLDAAAVVVVTVCTGIEGRSGALPFAARLCLRP